MGEPAKYRTRSYNMRGRKTAPPEKVKTDHSAKWDTDSGMTPEQKRTVLEVEEQYRDRYTETGHIIDANGRIRAVSKNGTGNSASFSRGELALYGYNSVITHNHPEHEYNARGNYHNEGNGMAKRIGVTFSGADLNLAAYADAKEIRANTPTYTYSVRRGENGWGASPDMLEAEYDIERAKQLSILRPKESDRYKTFTIKDKDGNTVEVKGEDIHRQRWARMNTLACHRAMQMVAKKYGLIYTRTKRHEKSAADAKLEASGKANSPRKTMSAEERRKRKIDRILNRMYGRR